MKWKVNLTHSAERVLVRMRGKDMVHVRNALIEIEYNPFAGDVKWLYGHPPSLRRRIGDWRILYRLHTDEKVVDVFTILRRTSTSYKKR